MTVPFVPTAMGTARTGRLLTWLGALVSAAGVILIAGVGIPAARDTWRSISSTFGSDPYPIPADDVHTLWAGRNSVYLFDPANPDGEPPGSNRADLAADEVQVTAVIGGGRIPTRPAGSTDTITRGPESFVRVVDFTVPRHGDYRIQITGDRPVQVIVARGLAGLRWFNAGLLLGLYLGVGALLHGLFLIGVSAPMRRRRPVGYGAVREH